MFKQFLNDDKAATSIEYALICGLISILIVVTVTQIGGSLNANYFAAVSSGLN